MEARQLTTTQANRLFERFRDALIEQIKSYSRNAAVLGLSLTIIAFSIEALKTALGLQSVSAGGGEYVVLVHWLLFWALSRSYLHKKFRCVYWFANIFVIGLFMVDMLKQI